MPYGAQAGMVNINVPFYSISSHPMLHLIRMKAVVALDATGIMMTEIMIGVIAKESAVVALVRLKLSSRKHLYPCILKMVRLLQRASTTNYSLVIYS